MNLNALERRLNNTLSSIVISNQIFRSFTLLVILYEMDFFFALSRKALVISVTKSETLFSEALSFILFSSIFLKSINWLIRRKRRMAFFWMKSRLFFIVKWSLEEDKESSRGPIINVRGVLSSWEILVKKLNLASVASFTFAINSINWLRCFSISSFCNSSFLLIFLFSCK